MNTETLAPVKAYAPGYIVQQEDEVSLVDLWVTLSEYRGLFAKVVAALFIVGAAAAMLLHKEKYEMVTTIQIGSYEKDGRVIPLEAPDSLRSKISSAIIPQHTRSWINGNDYGATVETSVSNPKGSDILLLGNKIKADQTDLFTGFQTSLAEKIIQDHRRIIDSLQATLKAELELARLRLRELKEPLTLEIQLKDEQIKLDAEKIKLKKLEDEKFFGIKKEEFRNQIVAAQHEQERLQDAAKVLQGQLKGLDETKLILSRNIKELTEQIKAANQSRLDAAKSASELSAMSQLLIDNQIQQNQNRLLALEERYFVTLENEKSDLLRSIEANRLQQIDAGKNVKVLQDKYDQLLLDNQLQLEQQRLNIEKVRLGIDKINFKHEQAISQQEQNIREIETRLDNFNETRIVSTAVPSLEPIGMSRAVLLVLVAFVAVGAGCSFVLLALFSDRVKQRRQELALDA